MVGGKAIVFGLMKNWNKGEIKGIVERFRELKGEDKLVEVAKRIEKIAKSLTDKDEGFGIVYSREERGIRGSNKILVIRNKVTAERVLEIISNRLVIQNIMEFSNVSKFVILIVHSTKGDVLVEKIIVRTRSFNKEIKNRKSKTKAMTLKSARKSKKKVVEELLIEIIKVLEYFNYPILQYLKSLIVRSLFMIGREIIDCQEQDKDQVMDKDDIEVKVLGMGVKEVVRKGKEGLGLSLEEIYRVVIEILEKTNNIFGKEGLVDSADGEDEDIVGRDDNNNEGTTSGLYESLSDSRKIWVLINDIVVNLRTIEDIEVMKEGRLFRVRRSLGVTRSKELKDKIVKPEELEKEILVQKARRDYERVREERSTAIDSLTCECAPRYEGIPNLTERTYTV
ncbi:hypothetical protein EV426DRAFT_704893 [Tirmania nivea]|nr:hypothetical protein EV426DRAFT_704893 [Tirmania nivea]